MNKKVLHFYDKTVSLKRVTDGDININEIALGLSNTCRFAGQSKVFYSVARHSIIVADVARKFILDEKREVPDDSYLACLLYNAPECILGSMPRSIRLLIPVVTQWDYRLRVKIYDNFNINFPPHTLVKVAADVVLEWEEENLFSNRGKYSLVTVKREVKDKIKSLLPNPSEVFNDNISHEKDYNDFLSTYSFLKKELDDKRITILY